MGKLAELLKKLDGFAAPTAFLLVLVAALLEGPRPMSSSRAFNSYAGFFAAVLQGTLAAGCVRLVTFALWSTADKLGRSSGRGETACCSGEESAVAPPSRPPVAGMPPPSQFAWGAAGLGGGAWLCWMASLGVGRMNAVSVLLIVLACALALAALTAMLGLGVYGVGLAAHLLSKPGEAPARPAAIAWVVLLAATAAGIGGWWLGRRTAAPGPAVPAALSLPPPVPAAAAAPEPSPTGKPCGLRWAACGKAAAAEPGG